MPLDPQVKALLDLMAAANLPPIDTLSAPEARLQFEARRAATPPGPEMDVADRRIPGPAGEIAVRVYRPAPGALPGVVFFHGGGWVIGDLESHDATCRHLAKASGCVVVAVDYRLAPEHRFPAAIDDAYAATSWVAANASSLRLASSSVAVAGDSAGGNLAAAVALMARERGPSVAYQLLVYPVTDHDFSRASYVENGTGYGLTAGSMYWFWDHYVPDVAGRSSPMASPLRASDLRGLPPAHVITAEYDPLRDEGEAYASALRSAGVPVYAERFDGVNHGFFGMGHVVDKAKVAMASAGSRLAEAMGVAVQAG